MKRQSAVATETAPSPVETVEQEATQSMNGLTPSKASILRWIERATPLQLAVASWASAAIMVITLLLTPVLSGRDGLMNLTESWGALERVALWQQWLDSIPGLRRDGNFISLPPPVIVYTFRFGMISAFVLQAWAFWQAWTGRHTSIWKWMIGPIGAHLIMLFLVPTNADVFFYAMSGHIANEGFNPYVHPLYEFANDPFLPYNHWVEMTTVYGPLWTDINRVIVWLSGADPVWTILAFKVFIGLVAFGLIALTYLFTRYLTRSIPIATAAAVLVAWQPNMVFESTGQVHNDILLMFLATLGIALVVVGGLRALRGAIVLVTASAAIKYVTLPLVGVLGLLRLAERRQPNAARRILGQWLLDGVAVAAVLLAAFLPYWTGPQILNELVEESGRLFSHPLWAVPYFALDHFLPWKYVQFYIDTVRTALQIATFVLVGWAIVVLVRQLWQESHRVESSEGDEYLPWWTGHLLTAFAIIITTLSLVPSNSHPWYWTWPVVPIAILIGFRRSQRPDATAAIALPRWFWIYLAATGILTLVYNTRIVHN